MSYLDLPNAGFAAVFCESGLPSSNIHELFEATYDMEPFSFGKGTQVGYKLGRPAIDVFVFGFQDKAFVVRVQETHTVGEFKAIIENKTRIKANAMVLVHRGKTLGEKDETPIGTLGICHGSNVHLALDLRGGGLPHLRIDPSGLDPLYHYDFSSVEDDGQKYMRGGHQYNRPFGWNRIAIKVLGKYKEGDDWLGPGGLRTEEAPNEWAVSYHGTRFENADAIIKEGFKPGHRELYGKGVYSSPSIEVVERFYAQPFTHEGKRYLMAFQNRVNPNGMKIISAEKTGLGAEYWLTQRGETRPYGVLFKEVR